MLSCPYGHAILSSQTGRVLEDWLATEWLRDQNSRKSQFGTNEKFIFQFKKLCVLWYIFRHVLMAHALLEAMHEMKVKRSVSGEEEIELFVAWLRPGSR